MLAGQGGLHHYLSFYLETYYRMNKSDLDTNSKETCISAGHKSYIGPSCLVGDTIPLLVHIRQTSYAALPTL